MDILKSIWHPSEMLAFLRFKHQSSKTKSGGYYRQDLTVMPKDSRGKCYYFLVKTSRSFAAVVQDLDPSLRDPICIFYLVLRGLDTVEDDMTIPLDAKVKLLRTFHEKLYDIGWQFLDNGENEKDRSLLQNFDVVIEEFLRLRNEYQEVIADICNRMGNGMADFANEKKVESRNDWDLYCHYVAGLVGVGLCRMFAVSGLESPDIAKHEHLANSMGLFLQKVNIIRDFHEDLVDGRTFWPKEIWYQYVEELKDLSEAHRHADPQLLINSVNCLNYLIADTLTLIPDCLEFMELLKNSSVFRFCAIPQVMAIATLELCFDNPLVLQQNLKIRKGLALKLMLDSNNYEYVEQVFHSFTRKISRRLRLDDPSALKISLAISKVDALVSK